LYIKKSALPTLTDYDYRDIGLARNFTIDITQPVIGTVYYIGTRAFLGPVTFLLSAAVVASCPSRCSNHGICQSGFCSCNAGFTGPACGTMTNQLTLGSRVLGFVGDDAWNIYKYQSSSSQSLVVTIQQTNTTTNADCDLYVKSGDVPTLTNFDYLDVSYLPVFNLTIPNPGTAMWYFGLYGYTPCEYYISLTATASCPGNPPCSNHGTCRNGVCVCNQTWAGVDCSSSSVTLSNGLTGRGAVATNQWSYFFITPVVGSTFVQVNVKETNATGSLWVFLSQTQNPDLRTYDWSDQASFDETSVYHSVVATLSAPIATSRTWYVGVYGNPFSQGGMSFNISYWSSPF